MKHVALGRSGLQVSAIGLGCMAMSEFYGPSSETDSLATLSRAVELGVNFLDTADMYGPYKNEELIGRFLAGRRERIVVATKFGFVRGPDAKVRMIDNSPEYIRSACEASLRRLGVSTIDLYYAHRIDPRQPIEETVGAMAELVRAGKVRAIGLSEVSAQTLRRAAAVHPIAAVQSEYSLWTRDPEREVLPACRELGTALVAYSPLGRGFLTGAITSVADLAPGDFRRMQPRFQGEAAAHNARLVGRLQQIALQQGCTAGQLALAWLLAQGSDVVPIPGSRHVRRLEENAAAPAIALAPATLAAVASLFPPGAAFGERYTPESMQLVNV
jgi:aryl-alcohol dehydrogenase-like predicted oxidoreductase